MTSSAKKISTKRQRKGGMSEAKLAHAKERLEGERAMGKAVRVQLLTLLEGELTPRKLETIAYAAQLGAQQLLLERDPVGERRRSRIIPGGSAGYGFGVYPNPFLVNTTTTDDDGLPLTPTPAPGGAPENFASRMMRELLSFASISKEKATSPTSSLSDMMDAARIARQGGQVELAEKIEALALARLSETLSRPPSTSPTATSTNGATPHVQS